MGYRSSIYIKFEKEDEKEFEKLIEKNDLKRSFELVMYDNGENDEYVRFQAHDLKWRSHFPDVTAINNWIMEGEEIDKLRGLIEIGEDGQVDEWGDPGSLEMCAVTEIDW